MGSDKVLLKLVVFIHLKLSCDHEMLGEVILGEFKNVLELNE